MNDAEKEAIDKIAKDFVRKASSLGAYEEAHLGEDENNEPLYGDYLKLEKELADILIAKQDEIERLKEENGILSRKADDANKLCSEKHDFMLSQFKKKDEQIERLRDDLSRAARELSAQTYRGNSIGYIYDKMLAYQGQVYPMACALKELGFDYSNSGKDNSERESSLKEWILKKLEEIQSLTARNKELEKKYKDLDKSLMAELRDPNGTIWEVAKDYQDKNDVLEARVKELEKSEKAFLETINQQGDEIKELESKIKVAREALEDIVKYKSEFSLSTAEKALAELGEK